MRNTPVIYLIGNADGISMRLRSLLGRASLNASFMVAGDAEKQLDTLANGLCLLINAATAQECSLLAKLRARGNKLPAIIVSPESLNLSSKFIAENSVMCALHGNFSDSEFLSWMESAVTARLLLNQISKFSGGRVRQTGQKASAA